MFYVVFVRVVRVCLLRCVLLRLFYLKLFACVVCLFVCFVFVSHVVLLGCFDMFVVCVFVWLAWLLLLFGVCVFFE